jgi:hypothetical protein
MWHFTVFCYPGAPCEGENDISLSAKGPYPLLTSTPLKPSEALVEIELLDG